MQAAGEVDAAVQMEGQQWGQLLFLRIIRVWHFMASFLSEGLEATP